MRFHSFGDGEGANLVVMQIKQVRERANSHRCMMRMSIEIIWDLI